MSVGSVPFPNIDNFGSLQAEADRITNEIQKRKDNESRELEQERSKKMVILTYSCRS